MKNSDFLSIFDISKTLAADIILKSEYPWQALNGLCEEIIKIGERLPDSKYRKFGDNIWVSDSAEISDNAHIVGPAVIGDRCEIRHSAYIRGGVIIGSDAVIGNSTELKNCILFDGVAVPHYNYIGDSILGYRAHFGAGAVTSNVKSDKSEIFIKGDGMSISVNRRKFGALVGDFAEIGCGAVLCPGSVVGKQSIVYPLSCVRGVVGNKKIYKSKDNIANRR